MIPDKNAPKYRDGFKASPGAQSLIDDLYAFIEAVPKQLKPGQILATGGQGKAYDAFQKHTLDEAECVKQGHPTAYHFHENAPPYCPVCNRYL